MKILTNKKYEKFIQNEAELTELFSLLLNNLSRGATGRSQLGQDIVALLINNCKSDGYFVEFGATNGYDLSNTYLLEKQYNWSGILAEPLKIWHSDLRQNRNCVIDLRCVSAVSNQVVKFLAASEPELSTIMGYEDADNHSNARKNSSIVDVTTVSLRDLLLEHNAPKVIDYLSIDTEGSELSILQDFDFNEFEFKFITIEHNHSSNRDLIYDLMVHNGYKRILSVLSRFDDWYVNSKFLEL